MWIYWECRFVEIGAITIKQLRATVGIFLSGCELLVSHSNAIASKALLGLVFRVRFLIAIPVFAITFEINC